MKKSLKKINYILLISMFLIIFSSINLYATENFKLNLYSNDKIKSGEEYKVTLKVENTEKGLFGLQGNINYNKDLLEYVDNTIEKDKWFMSVFDEEKGLFMAEIKDEGFGDENAYLNSGEDLVTFKFKVKKNASQNDLGISISNIIAVDSDMEKIESETLNFETENKNVFIIIGVVIVVIFILVSLKKKNRSKK